MPEENMQKHAMLHKFIALGFNFQHLYYLNISTAYQLRILTYIEYAKQPRKG